MKTFLQVSLLAVLIAIAAIITYPKLESNQEKVFDIPYYMVIVWNGEFQFYKKATTYEFKFEGEE